MSSHNQNHYARNSNPHGGNPGNPPRNSTHSGHSGNPPRNSTYSGNSGYTNNNYPPRNSTYSGYSANPSGPSGPRSEKALSANSVDLDASRLSAGSFSSVSSVTLGGCHYPVGSTVGTSGMFVIGDPSAGSHKRPQSTASLNTTSHSIRHMIATQGYDFEDWNWPVIRFSCFLFLIAIMIGLLAAVIALVVHAQSSCITRFEWWQGAVIYRIPVIEFFDSGNDLIGDFRGIEQRVDYLRYLGVSVVTLTNALPIWYPFWDRTISFNLNSGNDALGNWDDFRSLVDTLHQSDIKVLLELNASYTSTEHAWFQDSRFQSSTAGSIYSHFYTWNYRQGSPAELWAYDNRRNEYYLHGGDEYKPLLNWTNPDLHSQFKEDLQLWLSNGIDGFYIADIEKFHTGTGSTSRRLSIMESWRDMLNDQSSLDGEQRILVASRHYLDELQLSEPHFSAAFQNLVNLIDYPITLDSNNMIGSIVDELNTGSSWQVAEDDPWVAWRWASMTTVPTGNWSSVEMLLMLFPGTPCIVAGQEIGRIPEPDSRFFTENELRPLTWSTGQNPMPYENDNMGNVMDPAHLERLTLLINERQNADSLRANYDPEQEGGLADNHVAYSFPFATDTDILMLKRYYGISDEYYVASGMSWVTQERDWSEITQSGIVITDSTGAIDVGSSVKFNELSLSPGQTLVLKVLK